MAAPWREPRPTLWRESVDAADAAHEALRRAASGEAALDLNSGTRQPALSTAYASAFAPPPPAAHAPVWHVGPRYVPSAGVAVAPAPPEAEFWAHEWDDRGAQLPPRAAPPPGPAPALRPHDVAAATAPRGAAPYVPHAVRPYTLPRALQLPRGARVAAAACGDAHALLLLRSGDALSLGANERGQLGAGDRVHAASKPRPLLLPRGAGALAAVAAHGDRSAATAASGDVARWGAAGTPGGEDASLEPLPTWLHWLDGAASTRVRALALGASHALLLTSSGAVFAMGAQCSSGQLGLGVGRLDAPRPQRVERLRGADVTCVAAGAAHSAALTAGGVLFTWGAGGRGRLGHSDGTTDAPEPRPVRHPAWLAPAGAPPDGPAAAAAAEAAAQRRRAALLAEPRTRRLALLPRAGGAAAAAAEGPFAQPADARLDAALRAAGAAEDTAAASASASSTSIGGGAEAVAAVACGGEHTLALTSSGAVYAWGANGRGQLGAGAAAASADEIRPRRVRALLGTRCIAIAAGAAHSAAVASDGRAFVWGAGDQGQLGVGSAMDADVPMSLPPPPPPPAAASVAAGGDAHDAASAACAADAAAAHPLSGVRLGGVACGSACTLLWSADASAAWACGAGAFGLPGQRVATSGGAATCARFADEHAAGVAAFAAAAVREMHAAQHDAAPRREALLRAGPFDHAALPHVLRALVDAALEDPLSAELHAATALALARRGARCSPYAFRRALLDALEDAGVRLLAACCPEFGAAHAAADGNGSGDASFDEAALRSAGAALRRVVRALGAYGGELLSGEDASDLAAGCPGSRHSAALADTALAARKAAFFRAAVPPEMAPPHALAALGLRPLRAAGTEADAARAAAAEAHMRRAAMPADVRPKPPLPAGARRFESALFPPATLPPVAAPVGGPQPLTAPAAVTAAAVENAAADALRAAMLAAAAAGVSAAELAALSQFAKAPTWTPSWQSQ